MNERLKPERYYYIWTIGCQMNRAESDRCSTWFENKGFKLADDIESADFILLNGCVVRQSAEDRVINKLYNLRVIKKKRPDVIIAVTGCFVEPDTDILRKKYPYVDYFFPAGEFPGRLDEKGQGQLVPNSPGVTAFVPIIQGCNNFCSYCIVPYRRGREKSRLPDEIEEEVKTLVSMGVKEVTLLGQNVDSYGHDLPEMIGLVNLLTRLNAMEGLLRIRFLTNHPKDMKPDLIQAVVCLGKVCEQINIPIQAGDNEILKAMRRGYTVEHYLDLIAEIRRAATPISLSTDIIVGFPGESDEQFQHTFDLLSQVRFDVVHVAAYSPRAGTMAARELKDNVPVEVKKSRLNEIEHLQAGIAAEINRAMLNMEVEVLVEGQDREKWYGRTRSDKLIFFKDTAEWQAKLAKVKITHTSPWSMTGDPVYPGGR
ncbi:MAG: MiaB/RimO family radical SAM methylthiotransferase [Dehalococcoidales bacterium]|nr:MiaB/RimO family radical SAM methylthiotransferase [Dehalococcoidales bacterium]